MKRIMWAERWVDMFVVWVSVCLLTPTPVAGFLSLGVSRDGAETGGGEIVGALNRIVQALDDHERHTTLYERVAKLEDTLTKKTANEVKLETEITQLRTKIPLLEAEIKTIPEMRKHLAEFEVKIEKLVHDYEAKLSTLASEVIRLKKNGARRKDLQTLSDGRIADTLRKPTCPEVGIGMTAERVGDQCLYFSWGTPMNWTDAHRHCQSLGGDLSAPQDLYPLKTFLHSAFGRGPSIWLGASYNFDDDQSIDNSTIGGKVISIPHLVDNQRVVRPTSGVEGDSEGESDDDLSLLRDLSGFESPGVFSNSIADDGGRDEGHQDDQPSRPIMTDRVALRDEPSASDEDIRTVFDTLSLGDFNRETLLGLVSKPRPLRTSSMTPVVDLVLLKDPVDRLETSTDSSHPSSILSVESDSLAKSKPTIHIKLGEILQLENQSSSGQTGLFRDVRQVLENDSDQLESKIPEQRHEESITDSSGKAKMNCMLMQQKESLEYELTGQPCNEQHIFVCEIFSSKGSGQHFTPDNMLHE